MSSQLKHSRAQMRALEDLPNVGAAIACDLRRLGLQVPAQLAGKDPYALYERLNRLTGKRHDPCLLDTFIAAVRFVEGAPARPWWAYTAERKRTLARRSKPASSGRTTRTALRHEASRQSQAEPAL